MPKEWLPRTTFLEWGIPKPRDLNAGKDKALADAFRYYRLNGRTAGYSEAVRSHQVLHNALCFNAKFWGL